MPKIIFNGQEYDNLDAMPPEVRQLYDLAASMLSSVKEGTPLDSLESAKATTVSATQFMVDGKTYHSLDELPAEARQRYEQAMQRFDTNQNGIPDMLEGSSFGMASQPQVHTPVAPPATPAQPALVTVVGEGKRMPIALTVALFVIVLLVGVVVFLLMNR